MKKKKFRITGKLIFNVLVFAISIYLIIYFFVSDNGLIDLLSKPGSVNFLGIFLALVVYDMNILMDTFVTLAMLRAKYPDFRFIDAMKVAFVGVFFGAITPSNTGGQPMQLYLLAKKDVGVGYGSACMTQKFIVYQIVTTVFSLIAVLTRFELFSSAFTNFWSVAFVVLGFTVQMIVTALFLLVSFSKKVTHSLLRLALKIMKMLKFVKNPIGKIRKVSAEVEVFHEGNKAFFANKKLMVKVYLLVIVQVFFILSVPYVLYLSFNMPSVAEAAGQAPANLYDFLCIQSFVLFTSNLVPLPGASGGAELAFTMYFGSFFVIGAVNKIKPAVLLWRFTTYYLAILTSLPFSYFTKGKKEEDARLEAEAISEAKQ